MTKLVCQECRHENEPERIYCHNCGARLDRSSLATIKPKQDDAKEAHRRLKHMLDPHRARVRRTFFKVSKLILGALALAALIQIVLPPDVPPSTKNIGLPPQINLDLETAAIEHRPPELRYTEEQVNAYLNYSLRNKPALNKVLQFERALLAFDENAGRMTVARSLFGYPLYITAAFSASLADGKLVVTSRGGAIGRLSIHPMLMKYGSILLSDVYAALERDRKALSKMGSIELHPQTVVLTTRP